MRRVRTWYFLSGIIVTIATVLLSAGCQTVNSELAMLFGESPTPKVEEASAESDAGPKFYVELREEGRKPKLMQFPMADTVYIQQALDQSGATQRFRRMKIELYRKLPSGGGHRLDVKFDSSTRQVPVGEDYAMHANDRLVVTEDTSTILDDMLGTLGDPLTKAVGN